MCEVQINTYIYIYICMCLFVFVRITSYETERFREKPEENFVVRRRCIWIPIRFSQLERNLFVLIACILNERTDQSRDATTNDENPITHVEWRVLYVITKSRGMKNLIYIHANMARLPKCSVYFPLKQITRNLSRRNDTESYFRWNWDIKKYVNQSRVFVLSL